MTIREMTEQREEQTLSPYATLSKHTKGREKPLPLCEIRTEFQRDRDRIVHSKAFRRLKHKTQVFITPEGDHYRTRLTHTLEVAQIARTIARALLLNEDLVEAIALGHDLGHTPFGHSGEATLNEICPYGFRHYEQSLRVVDHLEKMNLTWEVRDGILNHTGGHTAHTLEGQIIQLSDRIAYINHDIDDAIRGGILREEDLPQTCIQLLGSRHSDRIETMVLAVIQSSQGKNEITMEPDIQKAMLALREFMFRNVYENPAAKGEEEKAKGVIKSLYEYFIGHPDELPSDYEKKDIHQDVCDYIAGMTDTFAVLKYKELFVPHSWNVL
jgi:dGTPase